MYYNVSFKYSDSIYCANIAKAECAEDVSAHYEKYEWYSVSEASESQVESAKRRGMPIINCPHIEPQEATQEAETMNTETTTTEQEAETVSFPRLRAELLTNAQRQKDEASERISKGYLERWNPASRPASPDGGIHFYSTATRWAQYQRGEITREKAVELATKRAHKQIDEDTARQFAKLDTVAAARVPSGLSVCVTWARSRTWGANPTATVYGDTRRTEGHASGCGYDKESAAIADAMNQQPEALRVLYDMAEKALADGLRPDSQTACTGYSWASILGYGSGYSVLPYFEGGCGSSTIWNILQRGGYTVRHTHSAKALDCWTVDRAESGKGVA